MQKPQKSGRWINQQLKEFYIDNEEDLENIDTEDCCAGTTAYIINTGKIFMLTSNSEWKEG